MWVVRLVYVGGLVDLGGWSGWSMWVVWLIWVGGLVGQGGWFG